MFEQAAQLGLPDLAFMERVSAVDALLLALKIIALTITATAGIYATFAEHPKGVPLRIPSRVALGVLVAALACGVGIELLADQQRRRDADRGLQPFDSLLLRFHDIALPIKDPLVAPYWNRLQSASNELANLGHPKWYDWPDKHSRMLVISEYVTTTVHMAKDGAGLDVVARTDETVERWPGIVQVDPESPLFPDKAGEGLIRSLLDLTDIRLEFYREPVNVETRIDREPDLSLYVSAPPESSKLNVTFESKSKVASNLSLSALTDETPRHKWRSKGTILALSDLAGAQMLLRYFDDDAEIRYLNREREPGLPRLRVEEYNRLRRMMEPGTLTVRIGARAHKIESELLKKHVGADGHAFWEYRFPTTGPLFVD